MISFKALLRELSIEPEVEADMPTQDNAIHASIRDEGKFMRSFDESVIDEGLGWLNSNNYLNRFPEYMNEKKRANESMNVNEKILSKHFHTPDAQAHSVAIRKYTNNSAVNGYLWRKSQKEPANLYDADHKSLIPKLDKALKSNKTPHQFEVYSSTKHDPRVMKNKNGLVKHPAYLSTTLDPEFAVGRDMHAQTHINKEGKKETHQHVLHITVPKDHHGFYAGDNPTYTSWMGEREFILPRGLNLHHEKTDTFQHPKSPGTHLHIHHMTIAGKNGK